MSVRCWSLGWIAWLVSIAWIPCVGAAPSADPNTLLFAQQQSQSPLERARELYDDAKFLEAAELLAQAMQDGRITGDDREQALELRARCLAKAGRRVEAREAFLTILRSNANYRADPNSIPPDEMEVFRAAFAQFQAEQVEAGKRYPSSIGGWYGFGQAVNQDIVDLASSSGVPGPEGVADDFDASGEFAGSVRFPIKPRWSVDVELSRLRAVTTDRLPPERNAHGEYTVTGLPIVVTVMRHLGRDPKLNISGLVGAGIMPSEAIVEFRRSLVGGRIIPTQILGRAMGFYLHAGAEAEYRLQPRLSVAGRATARYANSGNLEWPRDDFELYETFSASLLGKRSVDFSGISARVGVRAYIGY